MVIATRVLPDDVVPWAVAAVMVIGGAGGGLVIAPNQTLALEDVPVAEGGLAGSVGQLGQRIGAAIGTAVALSLFYATIFRESGDEPQTVDLPRRLRDRHDGGGRAARARAARRRRRPRRSTA